MAKVMRARPLDEDVYTLARRRCEQILSDFDRVVVAFSGGKDSTAVLNVTLETIHSDLKRFGRHLPLKVAFWDEEAIPYETEEYVRRVYQREDVDLMWFCLPVRHQNACSRKQPYWWPWAPEDREKWCRPLPPEAITELPGFPIWPQEHRLTIAESNGLICPPEEGTWAFLMGVRAQESLSRRRAVSWGGREHNYLVPRNPRKPVGGSKQQESRIRVGVGNIWKAYPIYDWTTEDVWTAPALMGWDYNRAYDRMEMAGIPHHAQRCSPAFGEQPIGGLYRWAQCFPDVWEKMVYRVPGVGAAVRYARTELYGFGGLPEKPDGVTWPEFIAHYVQQHGEKTRRIVAGRVRDIIRRHYRHTPHPILPHTVHPDTGLDQGFLLSIAIRGDLKERRQEAYKIPPLERRAEAWRRYCDDLARIIAEGRFGELGHPGPPPADPYALIPPEFRGE